MTKKLPFFDRLQIVNPCPADWEHMAGNDRVRHCAECNKNVYDLSKMTRDEAEALVARMEGRLCARFERQPDGTILTAPTPVSPHLANRRASPVTTVLVTAILGLSGNAFAAASLQANKPALIHAQSKTDKDNDKLGDGSATISGTVLDPQGAVIVGATVTLASSTGGNRRLINSDGDGTFRFTALPAGAYTLQVSAPGFAPFQLFNVALQANDHFQTEARLPAALAVPMPGGAMVARIPQTLRALYAQSELIVIASIAKSVSVKEASNNSQMKTTLAISSVLKGHSRRSTITVNHWGWGEGKQFPGGFVAGDKLLLFLTPSKAGGYEVEEPINGVKKLSDADLGVYRQRVAELAAINASAKPDAPAIVDWLVRCAEEPATRWEGAYEIAASVRRISDDTVDEAEAEDADADTDGEEAASPDEDQGMATVNQANPDADQQADEEDGDCTLADSDSKIARMLTDAQKERLKTALFKTETLTERDSEMIEIVQLWHDARLVPFLVAQLHRMEADPPDFAAVLIQTIADAMKDETISQFAAAYIDNVTDEDAEDEVSNDEDSEVEAADETADETEVTASAEDDEKAEAEKLREQHRIALAKFLALVEKKLAH